MKKGKFAGEEVYPDTVVQPPLPSITIADLQVPSSGQVSLTRHQLCAGCWPEIPVGKPEPQPDDILTMAGPSDGGQQAASASEAQVLRLRGGSGEVVCEVCDSQIDCGLAMKPHLDGSRRCYNFYAEKYNTKATEIISLKSHTCLYCNSEGYTIPHLKLSSACAVRYLRMFEINDDMSVRDLSLKPLQINKLKKNYI